MRSNYLFYTKGKLSEFLSRQKEKIREVIENIPKDETEKEDTHDISQAIMKKYTLSAPKLDKDKLKKIIEKDTQIKKIIRISHKSGRLTVGPREKEIAVDAKEVIVEVPFTGDKRLFTYQPAKHILTIPKGKVVGDSLRIKLIFREEEGVPFDLRLRHQLERIEFYLKGVFDEVDAYNRSLPDYTQELVENRKSGGDLSTKGDQKK